jgi:NAD(P)-dependent dehydrogenase (short-subunit alcohol dehydrogenase family)
LKRRVIVTGAAAGLGAAIAEKFASSGAGVLMVDIHPETEARAKKVSGDVHALRCDLTQADCGTKILEAAQTKLGGCDVLINNAAWSMHKLVEETKVEDFDRLIAINQRAPFFLTQAFVRNLDQAKEKPADPCIVHISSANAASGNINLVAYAGTKGALESMTRAMAVELSPRGIRVNAVQPGSLDTEQFRENSKQYDAEALWHDFLIKKPIPCSDVADIVAFLCGSSARHVTGAVWTIDGGYSAH